MNYKKVITAILLVSDGSVNHKYFLENFNISNEDLVNIFDEINDELKHIKTYVNEQKDVRKYLLKQKKLMIGKNEK